VIVRSADALVLRTYRYGEADRIVVFLTIDHGKKRGVAKNASKSRRRFGGALEPLTRGRVHYVERENRDLVRLDRIEPTRSPMQVMAGAGEGAAGGQESDGAGVLAHASYFAELLDEWSPDAAVNERLFRLGAGVGDVLGRGGSVEALARYFEFWLLKIEGVYPAIEDTDLSAEAREFLMTARRRTPRQITKHPTESRVLRELERTHQRMIAMHLEKDLKSARIVRELRRDL
jgi:DNA repair protein RecO (recombination protein O)